VTLFESAKTAKPTDAGRTLGRVRYPQDDFASLVRRTREHFMRHARFLEWYCRGHLRNQCPAFKQLRDRIQTGFGHLYNEEDGANVAMLRCLRKRRHNRHEDPALLQNAKRSLPRISSNRVDHHVDRRHNILELCRLVVHNLLSAQTSYILEIGGPRSCEDLQACILRELHGICAHVARRSMDKNRLSGFRFSMLEQHLPGSDRYDWRRSSLQRAQRFRLSGHHLG